MSQSSVFTYSPREPIANFELHGKRYQIYASTANENLNKNDHSNFQFRYQPLFLPRLDFNGNLAIQTKKIESIQKYRIYLTIDLDNNIAQNLAFLALIEKQKFSNVDIQKSNIFAMPIRYAKINIEDVDKHHDLKIIDKEFDFSGSEKSFSIQIETSNEGLLNIITQDILPHAKIKYEYLSSVNKLGQNYVKVTFDKIKDSPRIAKLLGMGDKAFVHRDDVRVLAEEISSNVEYSSIIENKDQFIDATLTRLMDFSEKSVSMGEEKYDNEKWNITYNKEDLAPDKLEKLLNKLLTKDDQENHWIVKKDRDIIAKANAEAIPNIAKLAGEYQNKKSLTDDELKKLCKQHDIHIEIEGNIIKPKSITLKEINLSKLTSTGSLEIKNKYIESQEEKVWAEIELFQIHDNPVILSNDIFSKQILIKIEKEYPRISVLTYYEMFNEFLLYIASHLAEGGNKYFSQYLIYLSASMYLNIRNLPIQDKDLWASIKSNFSQINEKYLLTLKDCLVKVEESHRALEIKNFLDEYKHQKLLGKIRTDIHGEKPPIP